MRKFVFLALALALGFVVTALPMAQSGGDASYTPKRINKAVELLAAGEPVYYFQISGGGYEEGRRHAKTWADAIGYNVEQAPFSARELREFIQGLIDGGPTPSGHRTPAVIVTLPVGGIDEMTVRANYWMMEQVLAAGAHGILLVHMREEGAARAFVQASRYPHAPKADGIGEGLRGSGGQGLAAEMWGISASEYIKKADPWPLNPDGELLLGFKPEDRAALEVLDQTMAVPGIGMVEWGPADMSMSYGVPRDPNGNYPKMVTDARNRILEVAKREGVVFSAVGTNGSNIIDRIDREQILFHFANEEAARVGRRHTGRVMPY
ncbi:MAG: aldolase/citrate lyase family protein [Vicinamibacterales bacterium]